MPYCHSVPSTAVGTKGTSENEEIMAETEWREFPLYNEKENDAENSVEAEEIPASEALISLPDFGAILLPPVRPPLDQNPAAVYLASLSAGSRRTMRASLNTIAAMLTNKPQGDALLLDWSRLRFSHTAAVRSLLAERYSHATANKMLAALRGTLKAAWRLGQMSAEEYQRACDVGTVSGETLPAGRAVATGELIGLMTACANEKKLAGARDAAMLALLYGCGLRRAELITLDLEDYDAGSEAGMGTLKVQGKRNKARRVPVVGGAVDALSDWLTVRGSEAGPLFRADTQEQQNHPRAADNPSPFIMSCLGVLLKRGWQQPARPTT